MSGRPAGASAAWARHHAPSRERATPRIYGFRIIICISGVLCPGRPGAPGPRQSLLFSIPSAPASAASASARASPLPCRPPPSISGHATCCLSPCIRRFLFSAQASLCRACLYGYGVWGVGRLYARRQRFCRRRMWGLSVSFLSSSFTLAALSLSLGVSLSLHCTLAWPRRLVAMSQRRVASVYDVYERNECSLICPYFALVVLL